jgi:hypothetical protein
MSDAPPEVHKEGTHSTHRVTTELEAPKALVCLESGFAFGLVFIKQGNAKMRTACPRPVPNKKGLPSTDGKPLNGLTQIGHAEKHEKQK